MTNIVTNKQVKETVSYINDAINCAVNELKDTVLPLGQEYVYLDGASCAQQLAYARFCGKWAKPDPSVTRRLTTECYEKWIAHEEALWNYPLISNIYGSSDKKLHFKVRARLMSWFKSFKPDVRNLEFTPGSSFLKTSGSSVFRKLSDIKHWTVTYDALDDALALISSTSSLWECALKHCASVWDGSVDPVPESRDDILKFIADNVLTIVDGARAATVYKNNETRRFINIEPTFNMLLQRGVASSLRTLLSRLGNDMETGQDHHKAMISDLSYATVDFSNASDSVHYEWAEWLLPPKVFSYLKRYRSYFTIINDGEGDDYFVNKKLSAMGNGFTFEIMTVLLLAYSRELDDTSRVYGDDVILKASCAERFINALSECSWNINSKKTFLKGPFRESCGAFFAEGHGYIESFDFRWASSIEEAFVLANKLRRIKHLHRSLDKAYNRILQKTPALLKGPCVYGVPPTKWVETPSFRRAKRSDDKSVNLWKKYGSLVSNVEGLWQKKVVAINCGFFFKAQSFSLGTEINCVFTFYTYLYTVRVTDDVVRGKGKWRQSLILLFDDGSYCQVSSCSDILKTLFRARETSKQLLDFRRSLYVGATPYSVACVHP